MTSIPERAEPPAPNSNKKVLAEEIRHVIERNHNEVFLRRLLTRAIILEKLQDREGGDPHG